jgi:lysophospholipase L1-like esterase
VLGGLYRSVIPGSVVVKNASTGKVYAKDVDYKLNAEWGQVLNLNGRMSGSLRIEYRAAIQRLDLIQVRPDGSLSVKQGVPFAVAPVLPSPDAGAAALAGIHVATLDGPRTSGFQVLDRDIHVVRPEVGPAAPINAGALPGTLARLRNRQDLRVTFFGDSITAGAEAGQWWRDRSKTYTSLVVNGLRQRFPGANVTETAQASVVGRSVADGEPAFQQQVLNPHHAGNRTDLLVIALGMNDKGLPNTDAFKQQLTGYVNRAKAAGMEVLLVTPMDSNPHFAPWFNIYAPRGRIAEAIRGVARSTGTAAADVYTDWVNQSARGVAPVSQLHNWFNHPGERGMRLYADALLRLFPA